MSQQKASHNASQNNRGNKLPSRKQQNSLSTNLLRDLRKTLGSLAQDVVFDLFDAAVNSVRSKKTSA